MGRGGGGGGRDETVGSIGILGMHGNNKERSISFESTVPPS